MRKYTCFGLMLLMTLVIGGCGMSQKEGQKNPVAASKNSDTKSSQDEFTKEFIESPKELQDGYVLFKSKTNGYTMLFAKNGKVSKNGYEKKNDNFEALSFGEKIKDENTSYYVDITFENRTITNNVEANLQLLSNYAKYDGEYEKFEHGNKTYYYATKTNKTGEKEHFKYFSYIKSNKSDKAISFYASSTCINENQSCNAGSEKMKEQFLMLMKSVDFLE